MSNSDCTDLTYRPYVKQISRDARNQVPEQRFSSRLGLDHNLVVSIAAGFNVIPHRESFHAGNGIKKCRSPGRVAEADASDADDVDFGEGRTEATRALCHYGMTNNYLLAQARHQPVLRLAGNDAEWCTLTSEPDSVAKAVGEYHTWRKHSYSARFSTAISEASRGLGRTCDTRAARLFMEPPA